MLRAYNRSSITTKQTLHCERHAAQGVYFVNVSAIANGKNLWEFICQKALRPLSLLEHPWKPPLFHLSFLNGCPSLCLIFAQDPSGIRESVSRNQIEWRDELPECHKSLSGSRHHHHDYFDHDNDHPYPTSSMSTAPELRETFYEDSSWRKVIQPGHEKMAPHIWSCFSIEVHLPSSLDLRSIVPKRVEPPFDWTTLRTCNDIHQSNLENAYSQMEPPFQIHILAAKKSLDLLLNSMNN